MLNEGNTLSTACYGVALPDARLMAARLFRFRQRRRLGELDDDEAEPPPPKRAEDAPRSAAAVLRVLSRQGEAICPPFKVLSDDGTVDTVAPSATSFSDITSYSGWQRLLSAPMLECYKDNVVAEADALDNTAGAALLLEQSTDELGGLWKRQAPGPGGVISNAAIRGRVMLEYRRMPKPAPGCDVAVCAPCQKAWTAKPNVERVGCNGVDHPLRCKHLSRVARHDRVRDLLVVTAKAVGMSEVVAEPLYGAFGLSAEGLVAQARADVRMVSSDGVAHFIDVVVVSANWGADHKVSIASAERRKIFAVKDAFDGAVSVCFHPLGLSSLGGVSSSFGRLFKVFRDEAQANGRLVDMARFKGLLSTSLARSTGGMMARGMGHGSGFRLASGSSTHPARVEPTTLTASAGAGGASPLA